MFPKPTNTSKSPSLSKSAIAFVSEFPCLKRFSSINESLGFQFSKIFLGIFSSRIAA